MVFILYLFKVVVLGIVHGLSFALLELNEDDIFLNEVIF